MPISQWAQLLISLAAIVALIFFMFYFLSKVSKTGAMSNGNKMRILDRVNLGKDKMLLVVVVCGKLMLIGVSAQGVEKICDLDATEEEYNNSTPINSAPDKKSSFSETIAGILSKKRDELTSVGKEDAIETEDTSGNQEEQ